MGVWEGQVSCRNLSKAFPKNPRYPHSAWAVTVPVFQQGFSRQSSLLFKILSSVRNHQINSDLAQLLLRLDYNKYYTQAGGTLGSFGM